ncbi:MAG: hypothetical protein ACKN9E_00690 [Microcystaceae cyanobacterium]
MSSKNYISQNERGLDTNFYVGYVSGFVGAHSQGETLDELRENLQEVIEMLFADPAITIREDEALARAIAEGLDDENVSREEVFALLSE